MTIPDPVMTTSVELVARGHAGPSPVRRPLSVRRTSTLDMTYPDGLGGRLRIEGRARDAYTSDPSVAPTEVDRASILVRVGDNRTIEEISTDPPRPAIGELVGCRGGGHLRAALDEVLPGERQAGRPLYLMLDDLSGATLIAGFVWSRFSPEVMVEASQRAGQQKRSMEGVCIGFRPGSSSMNVDGTSRATHRVRPVGPLVPDEDPHAWHELDELPEVSMRRARRIDVWRDEASGVIQIDGAFQDSAGDPEHGRVAVHEYRLQATADPHALTLTSVSADPRILPYLECPSATLNVGRVVGVPLVELRSAVLETLARTNGCTHLNDALRSLAEVPVLLDHLDRQLQG